ncbi:MAG: conjugal transfer protein TraX [archaeon]|nr:conjugal transfer protein TraX [archaeon]
MFKSNVAISDSFSLNRNHLKYVVIILMLFDYVNIFLPPSSSLTFIIGFFSRLLLQQWHYLLLKGNFYTRNLKKYMKRLFIFAIISYIPFCLHRTAELIPIQLFSGNTVPLFFKPYGVLVNEPHVFLSSLNSTLVIHQTSVIFTLFLGLVAIYLWDKVKIRIMQKL